MFTAAECVTSNKFIVGQITDVHIRLDHRYFDSVTGVLGQSLRNVRQVHVGDEARVTMALMPDKTTLTCVKASITKSNFVADAILKNSLHGPINPLTPLRINTALDVLRSRGLDANGTYVGIGRLVQAFKAIAKARKDLQPGEVDEFKSAKVDGHLVTVHCSTSAVAMTAVGSDVASESVDTSKDDRPQLTRLPDIQPIAQSPPRTALELRERVDGRVTLRSQPLLPTPSPDNGTREERTVMLKESKRQREQSSEQGESVKRKKVEEKVVEPPEIEESAPVKRMGRREMVERLKKVILESSELLTMVANVDAELLAGIVQR